MAAALRIILGPDDSSKLILSSGIPNTVDELKSQIQRHFDLSGDFRLQFMDKDFDNEFMNLTSTADIQDKSTIKVIHLASASMNNPFHSTPLSSLDESAYFMSAVTDTLSLAESTSSVSSLRSQPWPKTFLVPQFPYEAEVQLEKANLAFKNDGTLLSPTSKLKSDILDSLASEIIKYKMYPSSAEFDEVAEALIKKHSSLKEQGSVGGYYGWKISLKYKMANYRTRLRSIGCPELKINSLKQKRGSSCSGPNQVKKPRRAEINYHPDYPAGETKDSLEEERCALQSEVKKKNNYQVVKEKMQRTFAYRRQEVIQDMPFIAEFKDRWPALFTEREVVAEFTRLTTVPLLSKFMSQLDHYSTTLMRIFKKKGGAAGLKISNIMAAMDKNPSIENRRECILKALAVYLNEDPASLVKEYLSGDMSAASCLLTEDQFLCSICQDVFTNPVSTPCGHNFCKACITTHWNINTPYQCPNCKEVFHIRPELKVNTFISEMAAQYKQAAQQEASSSSEQRVSKPGDVPCDVCSGTKLKAQKSCLVCLVSYCEIHLEHHLTASRLQRHQLIDPVENLEGRMCEKHDKLLELFCKNDQMCVCMLCSVTDHKTHDVVPLKEEYEGKKAELGKTEAEIQQMIQKRRQKIQEIKHSVELSDEKADREISEGVQVFTALMETVQRNLNKLLDTIKEKQRTTEKQAEGFIKELEQEISELEKRSTEVKQLSGSEDQLHLLQNFTSLNAAPPTKDWTGVRVHPPSYEGTVVRAVSQLEETIREQMKKLYEEELKRVQQYEVDVTLDPDTAHPHLILSDDGKQVKDGDEYKNLPDTPERFDMCPIVLSKQSFSSGRFYFEVQVKGKTDWNVGVAKESINRKGEISLSPRDGFWTIWLMNEDEYHALADPPVRLSLKSGPEKVGVFVDYEEGLVSFYDVDAAALIYSFTGCSFTEKLYPYFSPFPNKGGKNSAPLIISPVNQTE